MAQLCITQYFMVAGDSSKCQLADSEVISLTSQVKHLSSDLLTTTCNPFPTS